MPSRICPYPGLRPFTEEESVFFKGRDVHIRQIVKLLENNKMAFITGASGDGKSSMVYAGVVPYIRAGYFKSKFNGWLIADFKPRKNPLRSLSEALAIQLGIDADKCESDLSYGFSSLVDLYKESEEFSDGAVNGRNLLIIADQFEEIFTNSDNFGHGHPSNECYTAVNLLLETIRISITEQLPVYVIFTMRSDFISQCTFFKNLPEYIAYSQFFVPQLKRTEIRQVIEEPALLAGGKVSPRLTEVLINNMGSGFDQLPVLQHALNMLWRMAGGGAEVLDLLHLAKIAGISSDVLPPEDRGEFERWFRNLPEYHHKYYDRPDLNNVLNAHAGILYESAYDYFMQNSDWAEKSITPQESKEIIEAVFKSLTKIDDNRPVRNRCTLSEITGIINKPNITSATVCGVINIFRTPDNSLIKPFSVPGRTDTQYISGDTVLDVTHEALIRNWKLLAEWDVEEVTDLKDYQDLNAQMQLWIANGRSSSYLLNSGSYTYFNQWFCRSNPNPSLFLKYDRRVLPARQKMKTAQQRYENYVEFLETSYQAILAKEKQVRRRVRIIIYSLLAFVVSLSAFTYWALNEKDNAESQKRIAQEQQRKAEEQQKIAENQQKIAEQAKIQAQQEKDTAQMMEKEARIAQRVSYMEKLRADRNYLEAQRQRDSANFQRHVADSQRNMAEEALRKLTHQKALADSANRRSDMYNRMAMSSLLAMKAKSQYEDKSLNLRLALTAYNFKKASANDKMPEIYDAVLFALGRTNMLDVIKAGSGNIEAFAVSDDNDIVCITQDACITTYTISQQGKAKEKSKNSKFQSKAAIQKAIFVDDGNVIYSTADHNSYLLNIPQQQRIRLSSQGDVVQSACITLDAKYIVIAYQSGRVVVLNAKAPDSRIVQSANLKSKIAGICCSPNSSDAYILTQKGEFIKWSFLENRQKNIFSKTDCTPTCIVAIPDRRLVALCFSDGSVQFVDIKTDTLAETMLGSHSGLSNAVYDTESGQLMLSGIGKLISVIDMKNLHGTPLLIDEHALSRRDIRCMEFMDSGKGVLALTDDNMLRYFSLDIQTYISRISKKYPKPLKQEELELILGRDMLFD